jgi:hypothetical protein
MKKVQSMPTMRWHAFIVCLGFTLFCGPLWAIEVDANFSSVDAFVKSLSKGEAEVQEGFGDLTGSGRRDWAGVVFWNEPSAGRMRQVVVLSQNADGRYKVAAIGPEESTDGGTGHHELDSVQVNNGSIFVSWSWNWHGCGGSSTQQIKLYKNQWRVIGAEFQQSNAIETPDGYDLGDSASMSHNLLTGTIIIDFRPHKSKAVRKRINVAPSTNFLDENFSESTGSVDEFSGYAGC